MRTEEMEDVALETRDSDTEEKLKDRWFDWFKGPRSDTARALIRDVIQVVEVEETKQGRRQRARKARDQETFEAAVSVVVCNALYGHLQAPSEWTAIRLGNDVLGAARNRYSPPGQTKALRSILGTMAHPELGLLELERGHEGHFSQRRVTRIRAGWRLVTRLNRWPLTLADFAKDARQEVIILKREKEGYWDDGGQIDYADTRQTRRYRKEVRAINEWLERADISCHLPGVDPGERRLRRVFTNGRFDSHGRLYDGFWINLSAKGRRSIRIEGEPVVALDYGQIGPRLAYAHAGVQPEFEDAYVIPGFEPYRKEVKTILNSALASNGEQTRFPRNSRGKLPRSVRFPAIKEAILDFHAPIASLFWTGISHTFLSFHESEIMVAVLLELKEQGIVALPIHDGLLVGWPCEEEAKEAMLNQYRNLTGHDAIVRREYLARDGQDVDHDLAWDF